MDALRPLRAFDGYQASRRWLVVPIAVLRKFADDEAGSQAALIAYYAFFSLFPLLLLLVSILGFALHGDPSAQRSVERTALGSFPVIGGQLKAGRLHGDALAVAVGLVGSAWGGLVFMQAAQSAFNRVWAVPLKERPSLLVSTLRSVLATFVLGIALLLSSGTSGLAGAGFAGMALTVFGVLLCLLLNCLLYTAAFRVLTAAAVSTRCLWAGALVGGMMWTLLEVLGGFYIGHVVQNASATYGTFALVIGLLVWLHLGAQVTLYAAEINVVLARGLWPRTVIGPPRLAGDRRVLADLARVEERSDNQRIAVLFDGADVKGGGGGD